MSSLGGEPDGYIAVREIDWGWLGLVLSIVGILGTWLGVGIYLCFTGETGPGAAFIFMALIMAPAFIFVPSSGSTGA